MEKEKEANLWAYAPTEPGEPQNREQSHIKEATTGIRKRAMALGHKSASNTKIPMQADSQSDIPALTMRYDDYLSRLLPLSEEISRLQDPDSEIITARNEAEAALSQLTMAQDIFTSALKKISDYKVSIIDSITETRRAGALRKKATEIFTEALKKIEQREQTAVKGDIPWPEMEYFDVRASMNVSNLDEMAEELAQIIENFNNALEILNSHLKTAQEYRDNSRQQLEATKKHIQEFTNILKGPLSVLDIYEAIERLRTQQALLGNTGLKLDGFKSDIY
jgi:chromosome segregation ATPase